MARYSIDEKILTDLADGIRVVIGKEEGVPGFEKAIYEFIGQGNNSQGDDHVSNAVDFSFRVPGASYVLVKDIVITADTTDELYFKIGYTGEGTYNYLPNPAYRVGSDTTPKEIVASASKVNNGLFWIAVRSPIENTNISISFTAIGLDENQNVLVNKEVMIPYDLTPEQMVEEINGLGDLPIVPDEVLHLTGNCTSKFSGGASDWLINLYGHKMTTEDITSLSYAFQNCKTVEDISFDLNCKSNYEVPMSNIFSGCEQLTSIPKINGKPKACSQGDLFNQCKNLKEIPEDINDWFDWTKFDTYQNFSSYDSGYSRTTMFQYCCSLRSIPMNFLNHINPKGSSSYSLYTRLFTSCFALDEIIGLPIPRASEMEWTSNYFTYTFDDCQRLKNMTFATNEDGSPIVVKWKNQTIDLSKNIGSVSSADYITSHSKNTGITRDDRVNNDEQYQALKDTPNWWSMNYTQSRYNHDSAVATINSLPDTSAFGTNTIKFKGTSGSATDGGAINTLTAEEIAVATARGWTVSLV